MKNYDYYEAVKEDIKEYLRDIDYTEEMDRNELYDDLWTVDSVTGNGSGSYTFSTYQAEENICHNMDLLAEALQEFGDTTTHALEQGAEYCDVTIRCYLLSQVLDDAIEEYLNER